MTNTKTSTSQPPAISRRNIQFLLHEWLAVERLAEHPRFEGQSRDMYDEVLELAERIATDRFAPHNALADANEPRIDDDGSVALIPEVAAALDTFAEAGLVGASAGPGGPRMPDAGREPPPSTQQDYLTPWTAAKAEKRLLARFSTLCP